MESGDCQCIAIEPCNDQDNDFRLRHIRTLMDASGHDAIETGTRLVFLLNKRCINEIYARYTSRRKQYGSVRKDARRLVDVHVLLDLLSFLHFDVLLLLGGSLLLGGLGLGDLRLGPVHRAGRGELNVISSRQDLGRADDGVDVLGSLGLSDEVVLEPLLVGSALLDLRVGRGNTLRMD